MEKQREKTQVCLAKRVVLFIPTYVASYSFWKVPCLVLAQVGMDMPGLEILQMSMVHPRGGGNRVG